MCVFLLPLLDYSTHTHTPRTHTHTYTYTRVTHTYTHAHTQHTYAHNTLTHTTTQMAKLPADVRGRGVITSSAGNHAQGVALAASRMVSAQ